MAFDLEETKGTDALHTEMAERRGSMQADDDERLAQLGHVQELRREFSLWSLGGKYTNG